MERRSFLKGLGAVIGGLALAEAVPLGRVYSFPTKIVRPHFLNTEWLSREQLSVMYPPKIRFHRDAFAMAMRAPLRYDILSGTGQLGIIGRVEVDEEINLLSTG